MTISGRLGAKRLSTLLSLPLSRGIPRPRARRRLEIPDEISRRRRTSRAASHAAALDSSAPGKAGQEENEGDKSPDLTRKSLQGGSSERPGPGERTPRRGTSDDSRRGTGGNEITKARLLSSAVSSGRSGRVGSGSRKTRRHRRAAGSRDKIVRARLIVFSEPRVWGWLYPWLTEHFGSMNLWKASGRYLQARERYCRTGFCRRVIKSGVILFSLQCCFGFVHCTRSRFPLRSH